MNEQPTATAERTGLSTLAPAAVLTPASRPHIAILFAVTVAGGVTQVFASDISTSSNPPRLARRMLSRASSQARGWCDEQIGEDRGYVRVSSARVVVVGQVAVAGEIKTVESDATTSCDPHFTADGMICEAADELTAWLAEMDPKAAAVGDDDEAAVDDE